MVPVQDEEVSQVISQLHIRTMEDWYDIPKTQIQMVDGKSNLLKKYLNSSLRLPLNSMRC